MTVTLLLGPVGSGKTDEALMRLRRLKADRPLAAVWALLASERQITAFRGHLLTSDRGYLHIQFFNFNLLYLHINQAAGAPRRVLHSDARAALLRQVLRDRWGQPGALFRPLPGFVNAIARQIDELKQWQIGPDAFAAGVGDDPKLAELALLYARYEARLAEINLVDREGLGALALHQLRANPRLASAVDWLLVDGFDQFNPLHAALIAELAHGAGGALVTLTEPVGAGAARESRFALALDRLRRASRHAQGLPADGSDDGALIVERLSARAGAEPGRRAVLHLAEQLWSPAPAASPPLDAPGDVLLAPGVSFLEAPDPAAEVAAVLRRAKALLLGQAGVGPACRPDDILIAVRDWPRYGPPLARLAERYGLPLAMHEGAPLIENPAVAALLRLLALPEEGYRRQALIDALASPYLRVPGWPELPGAGAQALEVAARRGFVVSGQDEWLTALAALAHERPPLEDEDEAATAPPIAPALAQQTHAALANLFAELDSLPLATPVAYVDWLDRLIGVDEPELRPGEEIDSPEVTPGYTLNLVAAVRADADPARRDRDLKALAALKRALGGMRASAHLLLGLGILPGEGQPRSEFLADLRRALAAVTLDDPQGRDGRILTTTVNEARGLPHAHVFVLGLSEGIFPAPVPEDPLLLESEREQLRQRGLPLALRVERADDTGLFYEVAGLAGTTLTLSRPTLRDGAEWIESALWRAAWAAFAAPRRTALKVGAAAPALEAATPEEAALAVAEAAHHGLPPLQRALAGWLAASDPAGWARLRGANTVEAGRLSHRAAHDRFSGRLAAPALIDELRARFTPGSYAWSASQLNTLGECAFRFFSKRVLRLESLEPPAEGLDARQRGTLLHAILERTYDRVRAEGLPIAQASLQRALALLGEEAEAVFARAPAEYSFRPPPGWRQEQTLMRDQLRALLSADFNGDIPGKPFDNAPGQGEGERYVAALEGTYDAPDLLRLAGLPVRVRGRFDRLDRQGDRWLVVDYKSGSKAIPTSETLRGRNFQMMIYLLALRELYPEGALGGFFWHLPNQSTSGALWLDTDDGEAVIAAGKDKIAERLLQIQAGDFTVEPNGLEDGLCSRYCEYQHLCRMRTTARRKPQGAAP